MILSKYLSKTFFYSIITNSNLSSNPNLNKSEMMTIILEYSSFNFNCFKDYYKKLLWRIYILQHRSDVKLASYKRLNRLMKGYLPYCTILLDSLLVNCHELSVVDFTSATVRKHYCINFHKVFSSIAAQDKTIKEWFMV